MAPITPKQTPKKSKSSKSKGVRSAEFQQVLPMTKAASRHSGKNLNHKKMKKVKVSAKFKAKVTKALAPKTVSGSWDQLSYDMLRVINFPNNQQAVSGLGQTVANDYSDWAFDPEDILHAASVLWNGKADSQSSRSWANLSNLGVSLNVAGTNPGDIRQTAATGAFQLNNKITLKKSWEIYKLKNVTQRTITMKIFLCAPKIQGSKTRDGTFLPSAGNTSTSPVTTLPEIGNPGVVWSKELAKQTVSYINVADTTVNQLYNEPNDCPGFNKIFKTDVTTIVLEPGQVYDYYINGPSNFTIDYNSLFVSGSSADSPVYQGIQKWMRYPLFTAWLDLAADSTNCGRFSASSLQGAKLGLAIERRFKYYIEMPESVGANFSTGSVITSSAFIENNLRRDCYFRVTYGLAGATDAQTINVQNPTMVIDQT